MQTKGTFVKIISIVAVVLLTASAFTALAAETYQVDTAHTYIIFRVKHLNIGYSYGRFQGPTGSLVWDDANPSNSSIQITVNAKDVDTDSEKRDRHLRSADFFNVEKYTTITFQSTSVKKLDTNTYAVTGDLTLLGQTHPVTVEVRQTGAGKDPWGKYRRGFETTFRIKRSDWGMNFMLNGVGDEVKLTVSVESIRQ